MNSRQPPDQSQRQQALDPAQSILVQAPAGSGKTDLLTRRFLRLLAEVDEPGQIVAITFTNAAAAEMRHRILGELEKAALREPAAIPADEFAMESLAARALARSRAQGWKIVDLPAQLRITTIDAFCREIALQQPLLTGLGGSLEIAAQPETLYRRAARATLRQIDEIDQPLGKAIEELLLWRDNHWQELEEQLVEMLQVRDKWMHEFVLDREPDWEALRTRLERPFADAFHGTLLHVSRLLEQLPIAGEEALELARFTCASIDQFRALAELPELPTPPFTSSEAVEEARQAYALLADFLLTLDGSFRKTVNVRNGFPADKKKEKARFTQLVDGLRSIEGLESALDAIRGLPPARYPEDDWQIVRACFALLRHAAGQLQIAFAEAGAVDFCEVAQIALRVLREADGLPSDAALTIADKIRHLLVDEFQDTSRRQHQLLASLIAAWPEREGRTCFAVGDPMQSIYFFRDADAELFARVKNVGLELPAAEGLDNDPLLFDFVSLQANFRTAPVLVEKLNEVFHEVFAVNDGSGVTFSVALPARDAADDNTPRCQLHLQFQPQSSPGHTADPAVQAEKDAARSAQIDELVALIQSHQPKIDAARASGEKFRIAVLGRARSSLIPIAERLRAVQLPFRAIDLEKLQARPEVLDALSLARALVAPMDRVAWLGLLRAPWCGLSLQGLHTLSGGDEKALLTRPIAELLEERINLLDDDDHRAAARALTVLQTLPTLRAALPNATLGTWIEQIWLRLGGAACVNAAQRANLDLLWSCLDGLPNGEQDLLGPALNEALNKLTALPDPTASSECGVQLMTIHKSKGLEFEVVIVPDLQARGGSGSGRMLSWLERGLAEPDESGEITEFLIAPMQPKGEDRGKAKAFVDRAIRERETQEMRRLLYVAATRAREELHLFALPAYKKDAQEELVLATPTNSLLATAWPALGAAVNERFNEWKQAQKAEEEIVESLAAAADSNLLEMPKRIPGTLLHRLPLDSCVEDAASATLSTTTHAVEGAGLYPRHEGGLISRALGTAVHALLEEFARLRLTLDAETSRTALESQLPRIAAQIRARGLSQAESSRIAAEALQLAVHATRDSLGEWILSPHEDALSEARWTGLVGGSLRTVQADRVFRAGVGPKSEGRDCWWIVDYKTAHADADDPVSTLPTLRTLFAPQLAMYAAVLRELYGNTHPIRAGLFYPRTRLFDWWEVD